MGVRWVFIAACAQKYAERCFDKIRHNAQLLDMFIDCVFAVEHRKEKSLVFGSGALLYALFALNNGVLREDVKSGLYDLL